MKETERIKAGLLFRPNSMELRDYTPEEWEVLRIGTKEPLIIDHIYKNTGQVSHLPYEGVVTRFNRLYRNRDIAGLKKSVQEEALSLM